jgi:hypothetical protein
MDGCSLRSALLQLARLKSKILLYEVSCHPVGDPGPHIPFHYTAPSSDQSKLGPRFLVWLRGKSKPCKQAQTQTSMRSSPLRLSFVGALDLGSVPYRPEKAKIQRGEFREEQAGAEPSVLHCDCYFNITFTLSPFTRSLRLVFFSFPEPSLNFLFH